MCIEEERANFGQRIWRHCSFASHFINFFVRSARRESTRNEETTRTLLRPSTLNEEREEERERE